MEKYIYISIKESSNLNLSIMKDFQSIIDKYKGDIDFVEYHLSNDEEKREEYNLVDYPENYPENYPEIDEEYIDEGEAFYDKDLIKEYLE